MPSGSCGSGRAAGPKIGWQPVGTSKVDWWHGHSSSRVTASYSPTGQPTWVHTLEYATRSPAA